MESLHALRAWYAMFQYLETRGISPQDLPAQLLTDAYHTGNTGNGQDF